MHSRSVGLSRGIYVSGSAHSRPACTPSPLRKVLLLVIALIVGSVAGVALRLVLFASAAALLRLVALLAASALSTFAPSLDPVYTRAAITSLVDLHLQGLAVAGPPGEWLHSTSPSMFADPGRVHWSPARLVVESGSPVLARLLAAGLAHAGVIACGLLVMRRGWRTRRWQLWAGLAMQAQVALGILGAQPSARELEATGVSFAANALLPWLALRGQALSDGLSQIWPPLVPALLVGLALALSYAPGALVLVVRDRTWRLSLGTALLVVISSAACASVLDDSAAAASLSVDTDGSAPALTAAGLAASTRAQDLSLQAPRLGSSPSAEARATAPDIVFDRWYADSTTPAQPTAPAGPSHVEIVGSDYHYQYLVNGEPTVIKGMGLNTQYAQQLSPDDRATQLESDMTELQALGVNTVLGWDRAELDEVLLDAAQRHGIGVILPFPLDPQADYTDPAVRQQLHDQVLDWVNRYREYPALRMWGLGNEVLHKIVHPAWVGPQDPQQDKNAQAFSTWLIETADAIHAVDPDHPVTYRTAEDAFVPWIVAALKKEGGPPRPWFVIGTNCYQDYLQQIVDNWPGSGMPAALWASEFAPGGMAVPDRPDGFAKMWRYIRSQPDYVLGGAVYAWTRNGPEGVDRNFGLTDDGVPVDGRSLDTLSHLFHEQ